MLPAILTELKEFLKNILSALYLFIALSVLFFSCGPTPVSIGTHTYILPWIHAQSFTVLIFKQMQLNLLPSGVHLIVTNPLDAFVSQVTLSLLLAFIISFPFFIYRTIRYLSPALFAHENRAIRKSIIPASILFFFGCIFAYMVIIPATFRVLFPYATALGATPFFKVNDFISYTSSLIFATGVVFLLPLFMVLLSWFKVVTPTFWREKWRHALLFFSIFSAIITPDGTGVTMILLMIPLISLYGIGALCSTIYTHKT